MTAIVVREIPVPANWRLGAHGDPIAMFDNIVLRLHDDGTVTWRDASRQDENGRSEHRHTSWEDVKASRSDRADHPRDDGRGEQ